MRTNDGKEFTPHPHRKLRGSKRIRYLAITVGGLAISCALVSSLTGTAGAAPRALNSPPLISSVSFKGTEGPGEPSPTITLTGFHFGAKAPVGTPDNENGCGAYTANGDVYGIRLYFTDDKNFEAGFSDINGPNCVGIIVKSWSMRKVVLMFGNAYGSFAHWYLSNGDGYAISIRGAIWGSKVRGLS
jgi:hypothetical protein